MRKGLILVVALLCMASMMAAMAFTSASVTNDMTVKLVDTEDALLALSASEEHNAATTNHITANMLKIDLNKGNNNESFGIQPHSTYTWDDLFKVTNNSENTVDVKVFTDPASQGRTKLSAGYDGNWSMLSGIHSDGGALEFTLEPGAEKWIDMKTFGTLNGHVEDYEWNLIVQADKQ